MLALWLVPPTRAELGPAVVELSGRIGAGRTTLQVTPFGTITARTHPVPLDITAALEQVDVEELGRRVTTTTGRLELQDDIEDQLPGLLRRAALREIAAAAIVGFVVAAAVSRRRWSAGLISLTAAALVSALVFGATAKTFDEARFEDARFTGSLARARQLVEIVSTHTETLDEARSRYRTAARRVSELMVLLAEPNLDPGAEAIAILHISDLHANPIGLEIAAELVAEFDITAVIDTGDLASSSLDTGEVSSLATPLDRLMIRRIAALDVPYLFVSGNHDSPRLVRDVTRADNAIVLDEDSVTIGGIEFFGWGDPTYSAVPSPESEKSEERALYADDVAEAVTEEEPDVLAVHDAVLATESVGRVPLVLSGHFHRRITEEIEGTRFMTVGSTGATGLKSLTVESDLLYEAEVLYFVGGELIAVDYLTLTGLGEDFTLERDTL